MPFLGIRSQSLKSKSEGQGGDTPLSDSEVESEEEGSSTESDVPLVSLPTNPVMDGPGRVFTRNLLYACCCSYVASFSFGYTVGFTSLALEELRGNGHLEQWAAGWFGSLPMLGAIPGSLIGGKLVDKSGRKLTLFLQTIPNIIGWFMLATCSHVSLLLIGRLLTGIGIGLMSVVAWTYVAEISPKELRGKLGTGVQLILTLGVLTAFSLGVVLDWRFLALIGAVLPIVDACMVWYTTETPRFYLSRGERDRARQALLWLRDPRDDITIECLEIEKILLSEEQHFRFRDLLLPEIYKPFCICLLIKALQQGTGIDAVKFYTVSIFQGAGFEGQTQSRLSAVAICTATTLGTLLATQIMDRAGRRILLLLSGAGISLTCFTMGLSYSSAGFTDPSTEIVKDDLSSDLPTQQGTQPYLALSSLFIYCIFFAIGYGPVPMLVMSEILPTRIKGIATSVTNIVSFVAAFIVLKEFMPLQEAVGKDGAFWTFSVISLLGCCLVYRYLAETKGRSLEDIQLSFNS